MFDIFHILVMVTYIIIILIIFLLFFVNFIIGVDGESFCHLSIHFCGILIFIFLPQGFYVRWGYRMSLKSICKNINLHAFKIIAYVVICCCVSLRSYLDTKLWSWSKWLGPLRLVVCCAGQFLMNSWFWCSTNILGVCY